MSQLALVSVVLGGVMCAVSGSMIISPEKARGWMRQFPRSRSAGWILATIVLTWSGKWLYDSPLSNLEQYRNLIFILVPIAILLSGIFVDELLAPRALGALFIVIPSVLLDAARWHESPLRLVIAVFAYIMVIKGCILVVAPYSFRKVTERFFFNDTHCRLWCGFAAGMGVLLAWLGFGVY
jgi:uncharacterized protein YjeT (DUF2065 family)